MLRDAPGPHLQAGVKMERVEKLHRLWDGAGQCLQLSISGLGAPILWLKFSIYLREAVKKKNCEKAVRLTALGGGPGHIKV